MDSTFTDLLEFKTYEDYLESFVTELDRKNLRNTVFARQIAELGYNSSSEVLRRDVFESRKQYALELLNPSKKPHELFSAGCDIRDPILSALAARERSNRVQILNTIIFLRHRTKKGLEISGYIDFEYSLRQSRRREEDSIDWEAVFQGRKRLWPTVKDLGFYDWRTGMSRSNNTDNFKVIADPHKGLTFLNRHDRKVICPDPNLISPGINTTSTILINSARYNHCVLYDHVLRKMI